VTPPVLQILRVSRNQPELPLPAYATPGSAGMDLAADVAEELVIPPGGRATVPTGLAFAVPAGHEVQVRPRSGLAAKSGVTVLNAPGTIDADYRGEVRVILVNLGDAPFTIRRGDRIAQAIVAPVVQVGVVEVTALDATDRGAGGFGSTGR
jgi:dUTP pyrophosphatase